MDLLVGLYQESFKIIGLYYSTPNTNLRKKTMNIFLRAQGRAAMMGFLVICGTYAFTGNIIPGIY